ncbi:MAG: tRNA (adenosine(37)-N6)-threonylcarbamoyltransferase complex ATPase subunit type 1 TsaE [Bacteroidales bacterium]|jgi:tRNA threonylcarbamoyladenosine biosynthesis protein TsaE|nr:tRNA (adenosine(37)-N6)-threonylcarbamoyltransferase complex ATPase subunit type 1 TsaE [Bacteroidales bacterium]
MENKTTLLITHEDELSSVARKILEKYPNGRLFAFDGEMGVGKTTLIKEICKQLAIVEQTSSPTFAIINEYFTEQQKPVYHFDFYRIEKKEELIEIGVGEYLHSGHYCFMEWPEKAGDLLDKDTITIEMEINSENQRMIIF